MRFSKLGILDIGPNFQVSQCVICHWRPFNTFHSVLLVAEIVCARLLELLELVFGEKTTALGSLTSLVLPQ